MTRYYQFCPVAAAAEIVTRPWTPLVIRELLCGSVRFNDIHRGVPRMSRTLLTQRLGELRRYGLLERRVVEDGRRAEYRLTRAGEELRPLIMQLGTWGRRWADTDLSRAARDPSFLMWDMQRRLVLEAMPARRVVIWFEFTDAPRDVRHFWLVVNGAGAGNGSAPDVDLCLKDPGYEVDVRVISQVHAMIDVWMGDLDLTRAIASRRIVVQGTRELRRQFPRWLGRSVLSGVARVR